MSAALSLDAQPRTRLGMAEQPVREQRCGSRHGWAVVQSHPQAERWAHTNLTRQGYDAYLPLITVTRRDPVTRTLTRTVERPLFTSYLFCWIDAHWSPVMHTRGVARLLLTDGRPAIVPDGMIRTLQEGEAARRAAPRANAWQPGSPCTIARGPFAGTEAVITAVSRETARLAMMAFGAVREITAPLANLAPREA